MIKCQLYLTFFFFFYVSSHSTVKNEDRLCEFMWCGCSCQCLGQYFGVIVDIDNHYSIVLTYPKNALLINVFTVSISVCYNFNVKWNWYTQLVKHLDHSWQWSSGRSQGLWMNSLVLFLVLLSALWPAPSNPTVWEGLIFTATSRGWPCHALSAVIDCTHYI